MIDRLRSDVAYLASDACLPRTPAANGSVARAYLVDRLREIGVEPLVEEYIQPIPTIGGGNVLGVIPGSSERSVLLAAHYDACDPFGQKLPGAGDNAAAVAVVLETARSLLDRVDELGRQVVTCLFDAEEPPYFLTRDMGSQWFVDHSPLPLDTIDMMICLDLVGHALGPLGFPPELTESIFVLGAELSDGTGPLVEDLPQHDGVRVRRVGNHIVPSMSDYHAFAEAGIPFLFYTVGRNRHYHMASDTPDTLDFDKMAGLTHHLTDLVVALSNRPDGAVRFDPDGTDDLATVTSLIDVLEPLRSISADVDRTLDLLEELHAAAEQEPLASHQRDTLTMIVLGIEEQLA